MTARVAGGQYQVYHTNHINTDPGVYEPECDWNEPSGYPDTQEFLQHYGEMSVEGAALPEGDPAPVPAPEPPVVEQSLSLAGDYQGLGGPTSVPLYTPTAFQVKIIKAKTISAINYIP